MAETAKLITEIVETSTNELQELPQTASLDPPPPPELSQSLQSAHPDTLQPARIGPGVPLNVFDVTGRRIATLVDAQLPAGKPIPAAWSGNGLSSGVYIINCNGKKRSLSRKMTLIKIIPEQAQAVI